MDAAPEVKFVVMLRAAFETDGILSDVSTQEVLDLYNKIIQGTYRIPERGSLKPTGVVAMPQADTPGRVLTAVDAALAEWLATIKDPKYEAPSAIIDFATGSADGNLRDLLLTHLGVPKTKLVWPPRNG